MIVSISTGRSIWEVIVDAGRSKDQSSKTFAVGEVRGEEHIFK